MRSLSQRLVDDEVHKEPHRWELRDDKQRGNLDDTEGSCKSVDEEGSVGHAIVDDGETEEFNTSPEAGNEDHIVAEAVEIVVEVSV